MIYCTAHLDSFTQFMLVLFYIRVLIRTCHTKLRHPTHRTDKYLRKLLQSSISMHSISKYFFLTVSHQAEASSIGTELAIF